MLMSDNKRILHSPRWHGATFDTKDKWWLCGGVMWFYYYVRFPQQMPSQVQPQRGTRRWGALAVVDITHTMR